MGQNKSHVGNVGVNMFVSKITFDYINLVIHGAGHQGVGFGLPRSQLAIARSGRTQEDSRGLKSWYIPRGTLGKYPGKIPLIHVNYLTLSF